MAANIAVGSRVRAEGDFGYGDIPPDSLGFVVAVYPKTFAYPYRVLFDGDEKFGSFGRLCTREELEIVND